MIELRCEGTLQGKLVDPTHLEVKCGRRSCGAVPGVVVLHTFDLETGTYTTRVFKDPRKMQKGHTDDAAHSGIAVRAS
jgi:hypothetical protein